MMEWAGKTEAKGKSLFLGENHFTGRIPLPFLFRGRHWSPGAVLEITLTTIGPAYCPTEHVGSVTYSVILFKQSGLMKVISLG